MPAKRLGAVEQAGAVGPTRRTGPKTRVENRVTGLERGGQHIKKRADGYKNRQGRGGVQQGRQPGRAVRHFDSPSLTRASRKKISAESKMIRDSEAAAAEPKPMLTASTLSRRTKPDIEIVLLSLELST